jgi:uncharacterized membrane protein
LANGLFMAVIVICMVIHAKMDGQKPTAPKPVEQDIGSEVKGAVTGAVVSTAFGM